MAKGINKKTVRISDFSKGFDYDSDICKETLYPKLSYNFHYKNGALVSGYGVNDILLGEYESSSVFERQLRNPYGVKFIGAWLYNYYSNTYSKFQKKVVLYGEDNNIYFFRLFGFDTEIYKLYEERMNSLPEAIHYNINDKDIMIFCSKDDNMLVWHSDNGVTILENVPKFRSICLHSSRLFAIVEGSGNKIWYSDNTDPTSWPAVKDSTIGVIEFPDEQRGKPNKILSFLDDIYVIRDFGISRITFYAKTNSYQITQLFLSAGKIYSDTVCVCNDKMYMMTSDGIYVFDGNDAKKLDLKFNKMLPETNINAKGAFFEGKYFVACKLNYDDNMCVGEENNSVFVNNSLISVDVSNNEISLTRGIDIAWLLPITEGYFSKMMICLNGENGSKICELRKDGLYFQNVLSKHFEMRIDDFAVLSKKKQLRQIYVDTCFDCVLKIESSEFCKEYNLKGGVKPNRINIMKKVDDVVISIDSENKDNKIKTLEIVYAEI